MTDQSVIAFDKPMKLRKKRKGAASQNGELRSRRDKGAAKGAGQPARRDLILAAALEEFAKAGFAATRLDDVAKRAGVAKGTIYLYFRDKEALFHELLLSMFMPIVSAIENAPVSDRSARETAEAMVDLFVREILGTRRKDVIRLVLTDGARFPKLAEFHYREVLSRVMAAISNVVARAVARGELKHRSLQEFPQLLVAPGLVAVLWAGLFDRFAPLDARALMRAHLDILFGERTGS